MATIKNLLPLQNLSQIFKLTNVNSLLRRGQILQNSNHSCKVATMNSNKKLAVFDFDHTIVDDNTDTVIVQLIKDIPKEVKLLHRSDGWTAFMQAVFKLAHQQQIDEKEIANHIKKIPPVKGMCELLQVLATNNYDVVIVSDSNSYFIDVWLEHYKMQQNVLKVFTNPAHFVDGLLHIQMYHLQNDCRLSTKNLCKGRIMQEFIQERQQQGCTYTQTIYCGDGANDFCPILRLAETDVACVRDKYKCVEMVRKCLSGDYLDPKGKPYIIKANVCVWNDAYDIMAYLKLKDVATTVCSIKD